MNNVSKLPNLFSTDDRLFSICETLLPSMAKLAKMTAILLLTNV